MLDGVVRYLDVVSSLKDTYAEAAPNGFVVSPGLSHSA